MLIAGDIGGTKTDLAVFSREAGPLVPIAETKVHSGHYSSLEDIVKEFLANTQLKVDRACFAVAGPVIEGRVKTTNLPWVVEENSLAQELNLGKDYVKTINDLEAIARAVPILRPNDVVTINNGEASRGEPSRLLHLVRDLVNRSSLGKDRGIKLTAPRAVTPILLQPTSGKSACSNTCLRSSTT